MFEVELDGHVLRLYADGRAELARPLGQDELARLRTWAELHGDQVRVQRVRRRRRRTKPREVRDGHCQEAPAQEEPQEPARAAEAAPDADARPSRFRPARRSRALRIAYSSGNAIPHVPMLDEGETGGDAPEGAVARPRTRGDCIDGPRPCPWVSCRHHLGLDVTPAGSLKLNRGTLDLEELPATCVLDVVDANPGGVTLDAVGRLMNLTRERVRQLEARALIALAPELKESAS